MICHFEFKCHRSQHQFPQAESATSKISAPGHCPFKNGSYLKYLANQNQPQTVNTSNLIQVINDFEIN